MTTLYCVGCGLQMKFLRELRRPCTKCRGTVFTSTPPYRLTRDDKRFLKSMRISPDEVEVETTS